MNAPRKVETLIVGTGVAGTAVAHKLLHADPNAEILMLEAGPKVKMKDFTLWQNYVVTGNKPYEFTEDLPYPSRDQPGENLNVGKTEIPLQGSRLMIYGGSTVHWGGWSFRLKPEDFHLYSNTGHGIDWPFGYDTLEPYYTQAEHYIGVSGDSEDQCPPRKGPYPFPAFPFTLEDGLPADAMQQLGIPYSHVPIARHGITKTDSPNAPCQTTGTCKYCPFGARFVAGNFLDNMRRFDDFPNLHVRDRSVVEHLIMADRSTVAGAVVRDLRTKERYTIEAGRVLLAAGAIEVPKLLLRSRSELFPLGVGNREGDRQDLVGRNFITHPYFGFQATLPSNPKRLQPEMGFPTLVTRYFDSRKEQEAGKFIIIHPNSSPSVDLAQGMQNGLTRDEMDAYVEGPVTVQLQGLVEIFSEYDNRVTNLPKVNHLGLIETKVNYSKADGFDEQMEHIADECNRIFTAMGATGMSQNMMSWRADHTACTVRMSDTPELGVVDPNLKVFDVDNLYICSNGVFSSLGAVNPTLTLTALALRLGDHLTGRS